MLKINKNPINKTTKICKNIVTFLYMVSLEVRFIKSLFNSLSRVDKNNLLNNSNLNDRERCLLETRFVKGLSAKESADYFNLEFDTYNKAYHRTVVKLYSWLENKALSSGVKLSTFMENTK